MRKTQLNPVLQLYVAPTRVQRGKTARQRFICPGCLGTNEGREGHFDAAGAKSRQCTAGAFIGLAFVLCLSLARAGAPPQTFLPDLLPADAMFCLTPADEGSLERGYSGSLFHRIGSLPEMEPFLRGYEESRQKLSMDISRAANISQQLADELVHAKLGLALINLEIGRDGVPLPEFVVSLTLSSSPDRETIYSAAMALLNRPEVVKMLLQSQGLDPNLPLKTLAQEETISGYPPILRIGPRVRVALIGNMVLLYHGRGSEGIKKVFDALSSPSSSLGRNPAFQATRRGAEIAPGMSFAYFNIPRLMSVLDLLNLGQAGRVADAIGLASMQAMGVAGGYEGDGVRHNLFLLGGGPPTGILSSLTPMPQGNSVGMEGFGSIIPSSAEAFMAVRIDVQRFLREAAYFLDSVGAVTRPGGVSAFLAEERILGAPLMDILAALGGDIVIRPHDDTQVALFNNVNVAGFENVVARMEQGAGSRFSVINVGGYMIRYFNRRASLASPLAPAFCLIPRQDGSNSGILYMASHPQAVVSLIQESVSAREPLSQTRDYGKATSGIDGNYSLFYYNSDRACYRRVYNFLLPFAALWSSSSRYPVDTGLLPTAAAILPGFFGCSIGIKNSRDGILAQAYSPLGFNALPVMLADKLVVNNPIIAGHVYALMDEWLGSIPAW